MILCILKSISPFKMHKVNFFSRKPEKKNLGFTSKLIGRVGQGWATLNTSIFYLTLILSSVSHVILCNYTGCLGSSSSL